MCLKTQINLISPHRRDSGRTHDRKESWESQDTLQCECKTKDFMKCFWFRLKWLLLLLLLLLLFPLLLQSLSSSSYPVRRYTYIDRQTVEKLRLSFEQTIHYKINIKASIPLIPCLGTSRTEGRNGTIILYLDQKLGSFRLKTRTWRLVGSYTEKKISFKNKRHQSENF